ncbi:MAG: thymidine phosphorylase, partial [Bacillota bacterium]
MRPYDIIQTKKEGGKLTAEEIKFLIDGYTKDEIPDYQLSAWAMAVYFQGMDQEETAILTEAMANSGATIDLSKIQGKKVDKHSTGGVGDTTTLVLTPLVAACGAPVAKMSGRGLGHTGGTIDKLESIPGFKTTLSREKFINSVNEIGLAVAGQTGKLAPADKKLYSLRDVTATVDSIPLIASSIMSKKIAAGADGIVLDVKTGDGAFMESYQGAQKLAETMVGIGQEVGRDTVAVVSDMNQPLGQAVGNSLEVKEAIDTLKGEGPPDLKKVCITLAMQMLQLANVVENKAEAEEKVINALNNKLGLEKLKEMIDNQGGNSKVIDNYDLLP